MIDPNLLLRNVRNAIAADHRAILIVTVATLDNQLSNGGELPDDWKRK